MQKKYLLGLAAAITTIGLAGNAAAAERLKIKGSYGGLDKSQVLELGKGHVLISVANEGMGYVIEPPYDNTPMQHAAGPCGGSMEIRDGKAAGGGYCLRTNPDGGKWLLRWEVSPDMSKGVVGKWEITGIEGSAAGWKGGGTFGPITNTTAGRYVNHFSGWLDKP